MNVLKPIFFSSTVVAQKIDFILKMSKKLEIKVERKTNFHSIAGHIDKYMFWKPPEKFIYSGKWKLEKTFFLQAP